MELSIPVIIGVVLVVWYFGGVLNKLANRSESMADRAFVNFERDRRLKEFEGRIKATKKVQELAQKEAYSDQQFNDIFDVVQPDEPKGK